MEQQTIDNLFVLLRSAIKKDLLTEDEKNSINSEQLVKLYSISNKHKIAHLLAQSIISNNLQIEDKEILSQYKKQKYLSIYGYERSNYELSRICDAFKTAQIPFIPLKGSIICSYYPEPWMRTSCDIDILIHEYEIEKSVDCLCNCLGYHSDRKKSSHDISLYSESGVHIELHFKLIEFDFCKEAKEILDNVWDYSSPDSENQYLYKMSDEIFYLYHLIHMAKHIIKGGCGIRLFLDLWILEHFKEHDNNARNKILKEARVETFAEKSQKLSEIWFSGVEYDSLSKKYERFILSSGIYGTLKNNVTVTSINTGSKFRHIISRIFLPYESIKYLYPKLNKYPYLLPFYEVKRWIKLTFTRKRLRASLRELNEIVTVSDKKKENTELLLKRIGLLNTPEIK